MTAECPWPVSYADCSGECSAYEKWPEGDARDDAIAMFEEMAADWLSAMTGGVFGVCDVSVRPCRSDCGGGKQNSSTFWGRGPGYDPAFPRGGVRWGPVLIGGEWYNLGCGCVGTCSCTIDGSKAITLPGPVQSVSEVLIDGAVLPPTSYRVDHQRLLVRIDGGDWPACQDLNLPSTEPNTWQVTYQKGIAVPIGGQVAAGRLACEFALAACDDDMCALPERIQSITRQGLSVAMTLEGETYTDTTGIWAIDSWIAAVTKPKSYASVRSVDLPTLR